jgi:EmrB/QacA subfamily drug resistance transporter
MPLLLTLALGVFAGALDLGVLSPALPALARDFGLGPRDVAWVFTLYLFANVVSIPIAAKLSDDFGRRPLYIACLAVFAAGSVLAIAAPTFWVFLVARVIQALGAGGIFPVATAAIAERVPQDRRGAALGMLGAVWGFAAILGPTFGGVITHYISWHWIFAANVPLALIVIVRARTQLPVLPARSRGSLDVAGIAVLAVGLLTMMIVLTRLDPRAAALGGSWVPATAAVIAVTAFFALVPIERRAREPILSPSLFARRQLALTYALEVLIGLLEGALFFVPAALVAAEGLSYAAAGLVAAAGAIVFVAAIPVAGRALDAFGSRSVLMAGSLLTAVGLGSFGVTLASLPLAIVSLVVAGVGFGALLGAPTRYIVANEAPVSMRATAVGLLSICLIVGQIVGGSLAGGIAGPNIDDPAGYRTAYQVFAALALVTAFGTLALESRERERRSAAA